MFSGLFSGIFGSSEAKKEGGEKTLRIFIEENSYKSLKKDVELDCDQICLRFKNGIPKKSDKSEFRILLVVKDKKDQNKIICKRILNKFERIFDGFFTFPLTATKHQYYMVDVQEYLLRQQYLPLQVNSSEKPFMNIKKVEREGILEMKNIGKNEFKKKRFTLTQDVLIYQSPQDKEKLYQILLLYIDDIYVPAKKEKYSDLCFYIKTTNKSYAIKCKSNLDRNVWIKSLIHFTNLAKERNIIQDITRKITQIKIFQFELETRNSIFDKNVVLENKQKMDNSFKLLLKHHEKFFDFHPLSKEIATFLKVVGVLINEISEFNKTGDLTPGKSKILELHTYISSQKEIISALSSLGWNNLSLSSLTSYSSGSEASEAHPVSVALSTRYSQITKFSSDLFYFLQRKSVSKNILLTHYYSQAEQKDLNTLNKFIV